MRRCGSSLEESSTTRLVSRARVAPVVLTIAVGLVLSLFAAPASAEPTAKGHWEQSRVWRLGGINMNSACASQYQTYSYYPSFGARYRNRDDQFSWGCYYQDVLGWHRIGGLDMVKACVDQKKLPPAYIRYSDRVRTWQQVMRAGTVYSASASVFTWGCYVYARDWVY